MPIGLVAMRSTVSMLMSMLLLLLALVPWTSARPMPLPQASSPAANSTAASGNSTLPTVARSSLPCPGYVDYVTLYNFGISNKLPFAVDIFYRLTCSDSNDGNDDVFSELTLTPGNQIQVTHVAASEVYYVRQSSKPPGSTAGGILMAIVFSPDLANTTWTLTPDQYGKIKATANNSSSSGGSSPNIAAIVGGVVSATILIVGVGLLVYIMHRRKTRDTSRKLKGGSASGGPKKLNGEGFLSSSGGNNNRDSTNIGGVRGRLVNSEDFKNPRPESSGSSLWHNWRKSTSSAGKNSLGGASNPNERSSLNWWSSDPSVTLARQQKKPVVAAAAAVANKAAPASSRPTIASDDDLVIGGRFRIVHRHKAALEDELTLWPGDQVTLLETYGDGWCLSKVLRSRRAHEGASKVGDEGMVPTGILTVADVTLPRNKAGLQADSYDDNDAQMPQPSKRIKSLTRPESIVIFKKSGRDLSKYSQ